MPRTKPPPAPRPTKTPVAPEVAARILPMQIEKQRRAARSAMTSVVARLHHLDDAALYALAREVWAELREREMTTVREQAVTNDRDIGTSAAADDRMETR